MLVTYIAVFQEDIPIRETQYLPMSEQCRWDTASNLIKSICRNFSQGLAFGRICGDVCVRQSVEVEKCSRHGRTYVILGKNKGRPIAMKLKRRSPMGIAAHHFEGAVARHKSPLGDVFLDWLKTEIQLNLGKDHGELVYRNFASISQELFEKSKENMTVAEMRSSMDVLSQNEFITLLLHQDKPTFPNVLGACGPLYFLERTRAYSDVFPETLPAAGWNYRVRIAQSFLQLIRDLEESPLGPLHHCDIKEENFGLTNTNKLVVFDGDRIYSRDKLSDVMSRTMCTTNAQCRVFDCVNRCNKSTRKCSNVTLMNNLQVICRNIFLPTWPRTGLLSYFQPSHVRKDLNRLLETCRAQDFGSFNMHHRKVVSVMQQLDVLLNFSLQPL